MGIASIAVSATAIFLVGAVAALPMSARAWGKGAAGERRTATYLKPLEEAGFIVLHDRRVPGSRANIDHVAIGPGGVWVIETKSWRGKISIENDEIVLNGWRQGAVDQALRNAAAVQVAAAADLERLGVNTRPVLCFHRTRLPWFRRSVRGVEIGDGDRLAKLLHRAETRLDEGAVMHLAATLDKALVPAGAPS
jgi:hypothetical protein